MMSVFHRLCAPTLIALAVVAVPTISAAEQAAWSLDYFEIRAGYSSVPSLEITEHLTSNGTSLGTYDWLGEDNRGNRFSVGVVSGKAREHGGWFWGAAIASTRWQATPVDGYSNGLGTTYAPSPNAITDWYHCLELQAGYQYGIKTHNHLQGWIEVAPIVSGGLVLAQTDTNTPQGYYRDSGSAFGYEIGAQLGLYLGEKNWVAGLTGAATSFRSTVNIDTVDVGGSELNLRAVGARFGCEAGYRF